MLLDKVKKYYKTEYDFNCSETIMYAANEEYNLQLDKNTLKAMAGFGGGMAVEGMCGVITGGIAVIGIMFTKERAHESDYIKELTKEYVEGFKRLCKEVDCAPLKELYRTEEIRCAYMIENGAILLDEIIKREMNN